MLRSFGISEAMILRQATGRSRRTASIALLPCLAKSSTRAAMKSSASLFLDPLGQRDCPRLKTVLD